MKHLFLFALLILPLSGCTSWSLFNTKKDLAETRVSIATTMGAIDERERQMTTAIKETLDNIEVDTQIDLSDSIKGRVIVAQQLAEEQERLLGIPIEKIDEEQLYQDWLLEKELYSKTIQALKDDNTILLKEKYNLEVREEGLEAEVALLESKSSGGIKGFFQKASFITIALVIVGFLILGPAMIPLLGQMLGWVLKKIPKLIGAFRVVSLDVVDSMVSGIEEARSDFSINKNKTYTGEEVKTILDTYLSNRQHPDFYGVINQRKKVIQTKVTKNPANFTGISVNTTKKPE